MRISRTALLIAGASLAMSSLGAIGAFASVRPSSSTKPISISGLSTDLQAEEHATFKAVYTDHSSNGKSTSITFEQKPPSSKIGIGSAAIFNVGGKSYYCTTAVGHAICLESASNPYLAMIDIFNPAAVITELKAYQSEIAAKASGVSVSATSKNIAGQSAACEIVKYKSGTATWCVTAKGYLAYASSSTGNYLSLQSFTSSVSSSDFSLPAGATIEKLP